MAEARIPVDLANPGQVFACLGFLEAADILLGDAEGGFDWSNEPAVMFRLRAEGGENPVKAVVGFLQSETTLVEWLSPAESISERDGGNTVVQDRISSSSKPRAPDLPGRLSGTFRGEPRTITFGFWSDGSTRFNTTFKKSTNGASSHIRFNNALSAIRALSLERIIENPFEQSMWTESLFRLDPRGSVDPINAGTSPDKLRKGGISVRVATYPICEALAVLGLEHARPERLKEKGYEVFRYHVWGYFRSSRTKQKTVLLPPVLARAAINGTYPFISVRRFLVFHEEVKKGGDRKITSICEEIYP